MNAKQEFIQHVGIRTVLCATVMYTGGMWLLDDSASKTFNLKALHTPEDYNRFLSDLDFNYDAGYGGQEVFGTIWYTDGTWSDRWEYDGSEGWQSNSCPEIPAELESNNQIIN